MNASVGMVDCHSVDPSSTSLLRLPNEVLLQIFLFLDYRALFTLRNTCQRFRLLTLHNTLDEVMFRSPYVEDKVRHALQEIAAAGYPEATSVDGDEDKVAIHHAAFTIKLHPALQAFHWTRSDDRREIPYNLPSRTEFQAGWLTDNATSPAMSYLHACLETYIFEPSNDQRRRRPLQYPDDTRLYSECWRTGGGLRRTVGRGDPSKNGTRWYPDRPQAAPIDDDLPARALELAFMATST